MNEEDVVPETDASKAFINFFADELKKIYWAEKHLAKSLSKLLKAATARVLKDAFSNYREITQTNIEKLEHIFDLVGQTRSVQKCETMAALIQESQDLMDKTEKGAEIREVGLMMAAQKIAGFTTESYTTLLQLGRTMGNEDIITLLEDSLSSEIQVHDASTLMAERGFYSDTSPVSSKKTQIPENNHIEAVYDSINLDGKQKLK